MIFVAEIGLNHDGNFDIAYELIRQAKLTGANIAKFQFGWRDKPDEINSIDFDQAKRLSSWCDHVGIELMASIITEEALELAHHINQKRYKIASRTVVDNSELCEKIIAEGKEVFCSLGFWDGEAFPFGPPDDRLHYIYCRSKYPTFPDELADFPTEFNNHGYFGYSDHCLGISGCLLAISRGAKFIEKHFTLNKTSQVIRDHILSATPEEFRTMTTVGLELSTFHKAITTEE